jgi:CRISPR-associated protein Csd2
LFAALDEGDESERLRPKLLGLARDLARASKQEVKPSDRVAARDQLCRDYYDIRLFGAVRSTGLNAGQVRGPVQLTFARSIDPITTLDLSITRQARTTEERMATGGTEIGRKSLVPYGLYVAHGFVNPFFAEQTGVSEADLPLLWEALGSMFEFDRSAAHGEMATRGLHVFTHENKLGNAPAHRLFQRIRVSRQEGVAVPRAFDDYVVLVEDSDLPSGIELTRGYE